MRYCYNLFLVALLLNIISCGDNEARSDIKFFDSKNYVIYDALQQLLSLTSIRPLICPAGYHDADLNYLNGCECKEENDGHDVGATCQDNEDLGEIGDNCTSLKHEKTFTGTLHSKSDVDVFFVKTIDGGNVFCDTMGDTFQTTISLLNAPPGLVLCTRINNRGSGCNDDALIFSEEECGTTRHIFQGSRMHNDSNDVTAWVMWHPKVQPVCGAYTLLFRARL